MDQLAQLRDDYGKIKQNGIPILAIIPADIDSARNYWQSNGIPIMGAVDPGREVMVEYGQEFLSADRGWMHVTIALDKDHRVFYARYGADYRDVAMSEDILGIMAELASEHKMA